MAIFVVLKTMKMMLKRWSYLGFVLGLVFCALSCGEQAATIPSAQQIVDKAIAVSGGDLHRTSNVAFTFRGRTYTYELQQGKKILTRLTHTDSTRIEDIKTNTGFQRFVNGTEVQVSDSMAGRYANSVNSVHYFAKLPFGLNDAAVNKEFLGEVNIKGKEYYKIKITFDEFGGGDDFDDVYVYWFNKETFKPDYLAYIFHVDGGGLRFRRAYNERYIKGIRFVDYENYKAPDKNTPILSMDSLYVKGELELLSKIELDSILVSS